MNAAILRACLFLLASGAGAAHGALAQGLADPTRPPNVVPAAGGGQAEAEAPSTQLQSVLLSPRRKLAVINGQTVALGEKVGDAVVTKITESAVVLKYGDRTEVLKLLGDVERKPVRTARKQGGGK